MRSAAPQGREGFTLIESAVALVLVSVTLMIMAPLLFQAANQRTKDQGVSEREALLRSEANRMSTLAFRLLDEQVGCQTDSSPDFPYTKCITVTPVSFSERTVRIQVTPSNSRVPADSVMFTRANARTNPFNTTQP